MFRNTFQKGFVSVFYSIGSQPLLIWDTQTKNGFMKRISDADAKSLVFEIRGVNVATTFISAPASPCVNLGIKLPFINLIVKNLHKSFSFEIQILDDQNQLRRMRFSNYQTKTRVTNFATSMPLSMNSGWNQIQLNLADFTRRAFNTNYMETVRITINANCRLRNVYFSDRLYSDEEKPASFKLRPTTSKEKVIQSKRAVTAKPAKFVHKEQVETVRPTTPVSVLETPSILKSGEETEPVAIEEPARNIVEETIAMASPDEEKAPEIVNEAPATSDEAGMIEAVKTVSFARVSSENQVNQVDAEVEVLPVKDGNLASPRPSQLLSGIPPFPSPPTENQ